MGGVSQMIGSALKGSMLLDEPMSKHTSWRAGGSAKQFYIATDIEDLSMMLQSLAEDEQLFWLGLGSNTLVRDGGFPGTVIAMQGVAAELDYQGEGIVVTGAGVTCARLAKFCAKNHLDGAEFFAGIPGLVGGALAMNAGAFGGETWQHVLKVKTLTRSGEVKDRKANEFDVGYRTVSGADDEWFISATLKFEPLKDGAQSKGIKQLLAQRAESQPIGSHSCGSVFKNPEGHYAAELIEGCGLKGRRIGGAVVSEKHANFIINDNAATAEDIESLIQHIQKTVYEKYDVELCTEVKIVGDRKSGEHK